MLASLCKIQGLLKKLAYDFQGLQAYEKYWFTLKISSEILDWDDGETSIRNLV